jgi:hypothetical protein
MTEIPKLHTRVVYKLSRRLPPACRQGWRKVRIRFFLAIILAFAGFKITTALLASSGGPAVIPHTDASSDFTTAAGLFTQCKPRLTPRLTCAVDTLQAGSDSLIAWYSLDTALQNFIRRIMKQYRPRYGAAVVMDPENGRILTSLWIYPWMVTMRESLYPNVSLIYGVPNATGYTPLLPQLTSEYLEGPGAAMLNLMRNDPTAAVGHALSDVTRRTLPPASRRRERRRSARGAPRV